MTITIPSIETLIHTLDGRATKPAKARKLTAADIPAGSTVEFERVTCSRCAGSGQYPSSAWQGRCLGCSGRGTVMTANARRARKIHDEWVAAHLMIPVTSIEVGMKIKPSPVDPYRTVTAVGEPRQNGILRTMKDGEWIEIPQIHVSVAFGENLTHGLLADGTVQRTATSDEMRELIARIAHLKGVTVKTP